MRRDDFGNRRLRAQMLRKIWRNLAHDLPCHFVLVVTNWLPDSTVVLRLRGWLLRPFFGRCGRDLRVGRNVTFYNPSQIFLGNHVYIAYGCWLMAGERIEIGNEVMFGPYCVVVSSNHTRRSRSFRFSPTKVAPIRVGSGVWIASHAVLTAGCEVGEGCLIAAHSVVVGSVPPDTMAAGQPARAVKQLRDNAPSSESNDVH